MFFMLRMRHFGAFLLCMAALVCAAFAAGPAQARDGASGDAILAVPVVTSISPTAGPTSGGTTVIITGTDFSGATSVKFGATSATFTLDSATQITATSPAAVAGTYDVTVTTPGGTSATSAADQFTYVAPPTVTSVSPTAGPAAGGTVVTLTGTNFSGTTAVTFGATAAAGFTVISATTITATSPAGAGTVDVRVTTIGGTSATSAADQYTYVPAPTVTSISPTAGPQSGGGTVIITGTNFAGTTAVTFGGTLATGFTVNSATQITVTAPAGAAGTVDVRVTTAGGTSATSAADQFTYVRAPTITSISPTAGPLGGGTSVIITGTNFSGATAVTFGATAATTYTVNSATQITAISPSLSAGTVDIRVTTVGGTSATNAADQFTYVPAPTVSALQPIVGSADGGTSVIIVGTNFAGTTAVTFGATAAAGFHVDSPTQITATSPAGAPGTVDVRVTTAGGTSATSAADQYTYVPTPTVTMINPTAGPTTGGTSVIITGTNFTGAMAVAFGGTAALSYTVNSPTQIFATSPPGSAGTVDIRVMTAGGMTATSAADQFTYVPAPTVTSISPTAGPTAGGTSVVVSGTSFSGATNVTFGGVAATDFVVNSATQITATSPAGSAGTVDVRVITVGGTSATSAADQFTYVNPPTVTSISPTAGPTSGGTTVIVTGTNFTGASAVTFGGTASLSFTVDSATQITATSPAGAAGTVDIRVTTPGGTSATSEADQFTYIAPPTVTSISPTAGPTMGGTTVIITGTNFAGATNVTFGGTAATGFAVDSATQITATSPAGSPGVVDVRVTTVGGTSATSAADRFTYKIPTDLSVAISNGGDFVTGGGTVHYLIDVDNAGPSAVTGAVLVDVLPPTLSAVTWTCVGGMGATCPAASGSGAIDATVNLPVGGTLRYTMTATVAKVPETPLVHSVSIVAPGDVFDTNPANDSATDGPDVVGLFRNGFEGQ